MSSFTELGKGVIVRFKNEPHVVITYQPVKPGKGSAFTRVRLKGLITGNVVEQTYKASDSVDYVTVERQNLQYLYKTENEFTFMRTDTYEQVSIAQDVIEEQMRWVKEGDEVIGIFFEGRVVSVDIPKKVTLTVTATESAVRGDTSGAPMKDAELETGTHINVPLFINQGDRVAINTETGQYSERV